MSSTSRKLLTAGTSTLVLCIGFIASAQTRAPRSESDQYIIRPLDKDRAGKVGEVREFLWSHWQKHHNATLRVTWYSKEGMASKTFYRIGEDEHQTWRMKVIVDRPGVAGTATEHTEYTVFTIERVERPKPEQALIPIPNDAQRLGTTYYLIFKDREGKQIGRGPL